MKEIGMMFSQSISQETETSHDLKTLPEYFQAVCDGRKTFEIRKNDRNFKEGDILNLWEWSEDTGYTKRVVFRRVTYILKEQPYVPEGYVCMGIRRLK